MAAYAKGIEFVRTKPDEARQYLKGYTAIEGPLTAEVPLAAYMLYNEFKPSDVAYFQKFFDLFSDKGIFEQARDGRADAVQGIGHGRHRIRTAPPLGRAARRRAPRPPTQHSPGRRLLPVVGPLLLFVAVGRRGAPRLHQADPAADAGRHARRAGHRPRRRAAAAATSRVTVKRTLRGVPDRRGRSACRSACCSAATSARIAASSS